MDNNNVFLAVELGSSKISGAAAKRRDDGSMEILAVASVPSSACIQQGTVYNLDKTTESLARLVELLERQLGRKILQVYTGYSGKSMRSVPVTVTRQIEEDGVVSSSMVDEMFPPCGCDSSADMLSLAVVSQVYVADNKPVPDNDPVGVACSSLEGRFQKIVMRPKYFGLLDDSFRQASVFLADGFVLPVALGNMVLTADERQRGCALVDYGAETTTVSIYKGGELCYLRVLPIGSDTITKDIMNVFRLNHDEAETLKCTYGLFGLSGSIEESASISGNTISLKLLGEVISARNEEIMTNVLHQIKLSGYSNSLFSGIVITGGGSNLRKLNEAMPQLFTDISPVRFVRSTPPSVGWCDTDWNIADGTHLGLVSLLMQCTENCCEEKKEPDMYTDPDAAVQAAMTPGMLFDENGESAQLARDLQEKEKNKEREEAEAAERAARQAEEEKARAQKKAKSRTFIDNLREEVNKFFADVQ